MNKTIVLDLDDVIFEFCKPFAKYVNKRGGTKLSITQLEDLINSHYSFASCPIDLTGAYADFIDEGCMSKLMITEPHVWNVLAAMYSAGDYVSFATARPLSCLYDSFVPLHKLYASIDLPDHRFDVNLSSDKLPKWKIVKEFEADLFVDNCLTYVQEVKKHNPSTTSVLYVHPRNKVPGDVTGIDFVAHGWLEVEKIWKGLS